MKIVLDTNVLVAAFLTHGQCAEVLEHCIYNHALFTSQFILREFEEKMKIKFRLPVGQVREAFNLLKSGMALVEPVQFDEQVYRDKDDDSVLGTAAAIHADCILTGDKDLLDIGRFRETDILKPADFWKYEDR